VRHGGERRRDGGVPDAGAVRRLEKVIHLHRPRWSPRRWCSAPPREGHPPPGKASPLLVFYLNSFSLILFIF
jgi:hypothetical protein